MKAFQLAAAMSKGSDEVAKVTAQVESYEQIKELISVDTLKTMQLLGFNYKAAIGEPLTQICANAISNFGNKGKPAQPNSQPKAKSRWGEVKELWQKQQKVFVNYAGSTKN